MRNASAAECQVEFGARGSSYADVAVSVRANHDEVADEAGRHGTKDERGDRESSIAERRRRMFFFCVRGVH